MPQFEENEKLNPKSTVSIDYLVNTLTANDMEYIGIVLKEANILLSYRAHSPKFLNGIEDFFANISIFLSPDIVQIISLGLATNIIHDTLKKLSLIIYNKAKGKVLKKIEGGGVVKEESLNIQFIIGNAHIIFPMDVDNKKFEYFTDKVFELLNPEIIENEYYSEYNEKTGQIIFNSKEQVINKSYSDWLKAKSKRSEDKPNE